MKKKESSRRIFIQKIMGLFLPVLISAGLIWPLAGLIVMAMMIGFLILSVGKGRLWCGYMCPRGSFLERWFEKFSLNKNIPPFLRSDRVRWAVFILMLSFMLHQMAMSWGNWTAFGAVFIRMCIVTSVVAFFTGIFFKPRTWCSICPMGTLQGLLGSKRYRVAFTGDCINCKICDIVCPVQAAPHGYKSEGAVSNIKCIKCGNCVLSCPKQALEIK